MGGQEDPASAVGLGEAARLAGHQDVSGARGRGVGGCGLGAGRPDPLDGEPERRQTGLHPVGDRVDARRDVGAGVDGHEFGEVVQIVLESAAGRAEERGGVGPMP
ncbi:hypothetical protein [Streptomyces sp. NPDC058735]|uniref:hypothetical protein n=1 Tax=unclassified Streptomyces TaxID=2593676 RepID=UPI0036A2692C